MTGGLVGRRDPAQPLLTYLDGPSRVELSGATTRNWVSKTANLLVDGFAGPERVGLLLPLHWQTLCLLLGTVASGATAVIARTAADLTGCALAFTESGSAEAALDVGVDDVLACSLTPFATRLANVPAMVLDAAAEIPSYGDHFPGRTTVVRIEVGGQSAMIPSYTLSASDRVLTGLDLRSPAGLEAVLGVLHAGAALVLLVSGDLSTALVQEHVTAVVDDAGLRRL